MKRIRDGKMRMTSLWAVLFCLLLSGCHHPGRMAVKTPPPDFTQAISSCGVVISAPEKVTPPEWYENMARCAAQQKYEAAAMSYLFAGTYSWYDAQMINTHYARSSHSRLAQRAVEKLNDLQRQQLWQALEGLMTDENKKISVCQKISASGRPAYYPDYMLMNSINFQEKRADKKEIFTGALEKFLHCP